MTLKIPDTLTEQQIREFQELYKGVTGEEISKEEAEYEVLRTLAFMASIIDRRYR